MSYSHCKNACRGSFFKISMLSSTLNPWDDIVSMTESLTGKQTSDFLHKENLGVPHGLKDRTAAVLSFVRDELGMSPPSL